MDNAALLGLYIPIFLLLGCVYDSYTTELLVDYTSGGQAYRPFRFHQHGLWRRFLLGGATADFMNGRSLFFPWIEVGTAVFLTACVQSFGLFSLATIEATVGTAIVVAAGLINIKTGVLPARSTDLLIASGLLFALVEGIFVDSTILLDRLAGLVLTLGFLIYVRSVWQRALGSDSFGLGDVHILAGISLYLGWSWMVMFFFLGFTLGGIIIRILTVLLWVFKVHVKSMSRYQHTGPMYILAFPIFILRPNCLDELLRQPFMLLGWEMWLIAGAIILLGLTVSPFILRR